MNGFRSGFFRNRCVSVINAQPLRAWAVAVFFLVLLGATQDGQAQNIAILPVDGPPEAVAELNRKLAATVARQLRTPVLSPRALSQQLDQQNDGKTVRETARAEVASAEKAVLFMNRSKALTTAEKSISLLEGALGQYFCPALIARAHGVMALARLLDPKDEAGAVQSFHKALVANPHYQVHPDHRTPTVERLLERARVRWQQPRPPALSALKQAAQETNVAQVFWLSVRVDPQGLMLLQLTQINREGQLLEQHQIRNLAAGDLLQQAAQWITQSLGKEHKPLPWSVIDPLGAKGSSHVVPPAKPWYKKWWVWTATSVVLIGVGAGVAASLSSSEPSNLWDLRVQFVPGKR